MAADFPIKMHEIRRFFGPFCRVFRGWFWPSGMLPFCRGNGVFLLVVDVMPIFEEWFEYDYEEVLLGAVKAETKHKHDAKLALRLRHRRPPTRPQK